MKHTIPVMLPSQVAVAERVAFSYHTQEYVGYVSKKGRKYAYIVCDDSSEFKVPYHKLHKIPGAKKQQIQTRDEKLRLQFHVNDTVSFDFKGQERSGIITRLNPKRAHIVSDTDQEYQVHYALLTLSAPANKTAESSSTIRTPSEIEAIAQSARGLMRQHHLKQWSFQFDNGTRRAGCCQYDQQVISISYEFARHASEEDIRETILHEIAHALAGKAHNHDAVWRAKAREIGCSGERCHDIQFTQPRYIVTCENQCWVATAERRRRNRVCKHCHGKLVYMTYTEERWQHVMRDA